MGADVVRLERDGGAGLGDGAWNLTNRNRRSVVLDLKAAGAVDIVLRMCEEADALIEGFRPGVMERLGLGPDVVLERNPRLVYGRMTGYGQDGPMSQVAGHDINYIAIAGALGAMRRTGERPLAPLNLVGDYGGGGMFLAFGLVCGILEARSSGLGQVVDAAMVDGTAVLTTIVHTLKAGGQWTDAPGSNLLAVYTPDEAPAHPHNAARQTFREYAGVVQPAPAPRFSRTPGVLRVPPREPGADTEDALADWGFASDEIARFRNAGIVG
jgi:alpha-methylacyl-CoA racemase